MNNLNNNNANIYKLMFVYNMIIKNRNRTIFFPDKYQQVRYAIE